ncbi:MAG: diphthine--ammonia ligase [Candidatus Woesearchaeota archaeon]
MCGIIGIFNSKNNIEKGLEIIKQRGPDHQEIIKKENFKVGHCLLAINSKVKQPLKTKDFIFTANCEIYNYQELQKKYNLKTKNDADTLFQILTKTKDLEETLKELDGVYSFCLVNTKIQKAFLTRDLIGVKPLWYYYNPITKEFAYSSEKKALKKIGLEKRFIQELNPRKIIIYDIKTKEITFVEKEFFKLNQKSNEDLEKLLINSIKKRVSNKKTGLLLSGGVDSSFIAAILKKLKVPFKCYVAGLNEKGLKESEDIKYAKKVAKELEIDLEVVEIDLEEVKKTLKELLPIIEDNNVVKAGVALPFYICSKKAKKDGVKIMMSGLGSEEIFAGYQRHKNSQDINEECLAGLRKIYEKDLYRDDTVTMSQGIELRLPFLDKKLVKHALTIPGNQKIDEEHTKIPLRKIAKKYLPKEIAYRKKKAAQYGSNFDKAIAKLAKKENKTKSEYLKKYYDEGNVRLASLMSTGKDSSLATQIMIDQNYEISCFITINSENQDSYMYHGPNTNLAKLISEASQTPLIITTTKGQKEKELQDLKNTIKIAIQKYGAEGIITGALYSTYQRERIEKICEELGIKCFSPLWHMNQTKELELLLQKKFKFCMVKIAAFGLDTTWLGKIITKKEIQKLTKLQQKYLINVAGEGGEYESLTLKAPFMKKEIIIKEYEVIKENEYTATMKITKATLK